MPPTLQNSPLLPFGHGLHIYIYIYIIDAFNLGLQCPCSYHHMFFMSIFNVPCIFFQFIWPLTQHCNLAYIFTLPFLMFFFHTRWQKKSPRDLHPPPFNTQQAIRRHCRKNTQLKLRLQLPEDFWRWFQIFLHLHQHDYIMHMHLHMQKNMFKKCVLQF